MSHDWGSVPRGDEGCWILVCSQVTKAPVLGDKPIL